MTPKAWKLLEKIYPSLEYDYLPIKRMNLYMDHKFRGCYSLNEEVRVVRRKLFDNLLLGEYLKEGGRYITDMMLEIKECEDGSVEVSFKSGEKVRCRYLVGADGANSRVRKYLNPKTKPGVFIMEQYLESSKKDEITFELSNSIKQGYYYDFPNKEFNAVGYCEKKTTKEKFLKLIDSYGIAEGRILGAFIPPTIDYPQHRHIFLVGDAGCWCDKLSYEGIYFALATGYNAAEAIIKGCSFTEANREIIARKRHRNLAATLLYNPLGMGVVKLVSKSKRTTERILNRYLR